jgi:adenosylcobinamide amidohydrolase
MEHAKHWDEDAGVERPVLVWRFDPAVRAVATTVLGGGIGDRSWAINAEVSLDYDHDDPGEHAAAIGDELELPRGHGVGLLTAARVLEVVSSTDGGVTCDATVGLTAPTWASGHDGAWERWLPGTINLVCHVPAPLIDAALVNAVATATEAKTQAMLELGVPGTGTASDAVFVCCPPGGEERYGGPRSTWGSRLARAVHRAVAGGIARSSTRPQ